MTVAIPAVTFPGGGTGRDMTGHRPASGLLVIMARPVAPTPGPGSQPVPPRWSRDRSGLWLRNAAAGLCVLAAAAAAVSFTAQYRMVAARPVPPSAADPPGQGEGTVPPKATKTARFFSLVTERHGPLAAIPLDRVAAISAALAPAADLNPGAARAALRKAVLAARNGDPS